MANNRIYREQHRTDSLRAVLVRVATILGLVMVTPAGAQCERRFSGPQTITTNADRASSVFAADLDGDGDKDVLSASSGNNTIAWYENLDGFATFGTKNTITFTASGAFSVFAADLDGDGDMDVLSADNDGIAWYQNTDGLATFSPKRVIAVASQCYSVFVADVDSDGSLDVLWASRGDNTIGWSQNTDGLGTFGPTVVIDASITLAVSVYAADLDGDGDIDVLSAGERPRMIAWYENLAGFGSFGPRQVLETSSPGVSAGYCVTAADIDDDGDNDILAGINGRIVLFHNTDGNGTFGPQVTSTNNNDVYAPRSIVVADLDGDGPMDLAATDFGSGGSREGGVTWYPDTLGPQQVISAADNAPLSVHAADLDGDGDMDILTASFGDNTIAWHENNADCNSNGIPDGCEPDCNNNNGPDACDINNGTSADCNGNSVPDECEPGCNNNGQPDACDINNGTSADCNGNGIPDECETGCNNNGQPDVCDINDGTSADCNGNGIPDECEPGCNNNGQPDVCDINDGTSADCDGNGIPDECEPGCNNNGQPDACDINDGTSADCNDNGIPDECEPLDDCNNNGVQDICDLVNGTSDDCNFDSVPDDCQPDEDCNANDIRDICDIGTGLALDCNGNLSPDTCDLADGSSLDGNSDGVPDECCVSPIPVFVEPIKSRYLSLALPGTPSVRSAIRITFGPNAVFPNLEGTSLWVGPPRDFPEENSADPLLTFAGAGLSCEPYYDDWSTIAILQVSGAEIVPRSFTDQSFYRIQVINDGCPDSFEGNYSTSLQVETAVLGDNVPPFYEAPGGVEPSFADISRVIDKFLGNPNTTKAATQFQPGVVRPANPVSFRDINAVIQSFLGFDSYLEIVPDAQTCTCPSAVTCGTEPCTFDASCAGDNICIDNFCMDPCGRCSP